MRSIGVIYGAILAAMWLSASAHAQAIRPLRAIPDCAGRVEIGNARVVRVERNGALILSDGRAILLEGIRLPRGDSDGAPRYLVDQSLALLADLAQGSSMTFTATPPKQDRYDRVRAQAFSMGQGGTRTWLQLAMLERGMARVAIAPDRNECAPDLYEAEARGRQSRAGIWAISAYAARKPQDMKATRGTFQVVEGWVTNVRAVPGGTILDFGSDGARGFSAVIQPQDRAAFRGHDLQGLVARHVRIRGTVQETRGRPEIALSNPAQIEFLD